MQQRWNDDISYHSKIRGDKNSSWNTRSRGIDSFSWLTRCRSAFHLSWVLSQVTAYTQHIPHFQATNTASGNHSTRTLLTSIAQPGILFFFSFVELLLSDVRWNQKVYNLIIPELHSFSHGRFSPVLVTCELISHSLLARSCIIVFFLFIGWNVKVDDNSMPFWTICEVKMIYHWILFY